MRPALLFLFLLITSYTCKAQESVKEWVGYIDEQKLSNEFEWFRNGYTNYKPDSAFVEEISKAKSPYTLLVFGAIWCSDTKELLPQFYKTIDKAGISHDKVKLYLLDEKKRSPEKLEKKYHVKKVPTFILLMDGKEVDRIIEKADNSMEADLVRLFNVKSVK